MNAPAIINRPQAEYYRIKLATGAVWTPCRLWFAPTPDPDFPDNPQDRSPYWQAEVRGEHISDSVKRQPNG